MVNIVHNVRQVVLSIRVLGKYSRKRGREIRVTFNHDKWIPFSDYAFDGENALNHLFFSGQEFARSLFRSGRVFADMNKSAWTCILYKVGLHPLTAAGCCSARTITK